MIIQYTGPFKGASNNISWIHTELIWITFDLVIYAVFK